MDREENKYGKQLTKQEAIALADSRVWENWDDEKVVRFQLFQKRLCMDFSRFHEAVENVLGRPVYTHEFGVNYDGIIKEYLGTEDPPTFNEVINMIPEEKRVALISDNR